MNATTIHDTLDAFGVILKTAPSSGRQGWPKGSRHFTVWLCRENKPIYQTKYSMGAALTGDPEREDVLYSVMQDAMYGRESFDSFCADLGFDTDSRSAYASWEECVKAAGYMDAMFTPSELETLADLFQDY